MRVIALVAATLFACAEPGPGPDPDRIMAHVRALTELGPRPTGGATAARALDLIDAALPAGLRRELLPTGRIELPGIRVGPMRIFEPLVVDIAEPNLVVRIAGADPGAAPLLLMAHADTVYGSPGAVDNAVSVALLVELARDLAAEPPPRPVILAFTAAEEHRLAGARALAGTLEVEPALAISLDMVGAPGPLTLNGVSRRVGRPLLSWLAAAARRAGIHLEAPPVHRVVSRHAPQIERSDHGVFTERGVPAVHLYNRGRGHVYLPYHGPVDRPERVDLDRAVEAGRLLRAIAHQPQAPPPGGGPEGVWISGPAGPRVVSVWWLRVVAAALALLALAALGALVRRRGRRPGQVGLVAHLALFALGWLAAHGVLVLVAGTLEHPRPWVHAPGRHVLAAGAIAVAVATLGARLLGLRFRPAGMGRFLAAAILPLVVLGGALVAVDAAELSLLPLGAAAGFGAAAFTRRPEAALLFVVAGLVAVAHLVHPLVLREAVFHGFFMPQVPLVAWLAVALLPGWLAILYLVRRWPSVPARLPLVVLACAVTIGLAITALALPSPPCTGVEYLRNGLGCELLP